MSTLKKENRAFLYFRENGKGTLNVKFGPEKFATDTTKFVEVLLTGNLHCLTFLSNLTKQEPMDFRMKQYDNMKLNYHAVLDQAFDDVFNEKKRIYEMEEFAIAKAESGEPVSPEFQEKIEEAKAEIKKRSTQITEEKTKAKQEEFKKNIEDKIQLLEETKEHFLSKFMTKDRDDLEEKDGMMVDVIENLINDEVKKLNDLYLDVVSGAAILL